MYGWCTYVCWCDDFMIYVGREFDVCLMGIDSVDSMYLPKLYYGCDWKVLSCTGRCLDYVISIACWWLDY